MAVAHDAATETTSTFGASPDPFTFSHTPVGTPKGVIVFIAHSADVDTIVGVSYGGVAMSRVLRASDAAGEPGSCYAYFLGSGIPTGAQTVSIDHNGGANAKYAQCITITAASNTAVQASGKIDGDTADPQIALNSGSATAIRYACTYSGLPNITDLTSIGGFTDVHSWDQGASVRVSQRETTPSSGSTTCGWTAANDDVAMVALAVIEVVDTGTPFPPIGQPYPSRLEVVAY